MTKILLKHYESAEQMSGRERQRLMVASIRYGTAYDSFLNMEDGRQVFVDHTTGGFITFVRVGKDVEMLGGLCAPENQKAALLKNFVRFLENRKLALSSFNVPEEDVAVFRDYGFRITKLGEELYFQLPNLNWDGKAFWKFRTKTNKCRKQGLEVEELSAGKFEAAKAELAEITHLQLSEKAQRNSLNFFVGQCPPKELLERRIFTAKSKSGRIEGFVVLVPYLNMQAFGLDSFRFRPDAPRNVMAYLIKEVAEQLQSEGVSEFSLGAAPGANVKEAIAGDKAAIRLSVHFIYECLGSLYDLKGVHEFKSQFRPERRNLYVCIYPDQFTFNGVYAFFKTFGMFDISFKAVFKRIYKKYLNKFRVRTLKVRNNARRVLCRLTH